MKNFAYFFVLAGLIAGVDASDKCRVSVENIVIRGDSIDYRRVADKERHDLEVLLEAGPESFIANHPWTIMSSPQTLLHLFLSAGVEEKVDPFTGSRKHKVYNLLSTAHDLADGKFLVGQEQAAAQLVEAIKAAASGGASGRDMPMLVGVPGSGKSFILEHLRTSMSNATMRVPKHFAYTFEWVDLSKIPSLKNRLPSEFVKAESPRAFADPINDSPFSLLPDSYQEAILAEHRSRVYIELHQDPNPKRQPNPKSAAIRAEIIAHYEAEKGETLSDEEIVSVLSKHIRIKRLILGDSTTLPLIAQQGDEPRDSEIFGRPNAIHAMRAGINDPFAWDYGIIPLANGGVIYFDELLKNHPAFFAKLLNLVSSHRVDIAAGVTVPIDILFLGATNTRELKELEERDPNSPLLSRILPIPMNSLIDPISNMQLLAMETNPLWMRPLGESGADWVEVRGKSVFRLVPSREFGKRPATTHRRFALAYGNPEHSPIEIGPHSLEFMAAIMSLSRMQFNLNDIRLAQQFPMVKDSDIHLVDRISRLKVYFGETQIERARMHNLMALSRLGDEGTFGLDHRVAARMWTAALSLAASSTYHNTLTPELIIQVIRDLVYDDRYRGLKPEDQRHLILLAEEIHQRWIIPKYERDLSEAYMRQMGEEFVSLVYDEMIAEMTALSGDAKATHYLHPSTGAETPINFERLDGVKRAWQELTGRAFDFQEVGTWFTWSVNSSTDDSAIHPEFLAAITQYYVHLQLARENASLSSLLSAATGTGRVKDPDLQMRADGLLNTLSQDFGYNPQSARIAIEAIQRSMALRSQKQPGR